ncbi:DUF305 domain-containing protein [Mycobacterium lehmannii]|uniref:DUF305 domain-containing protein n=1 Tax=Mycobacterium lehmannii TaxID=2048550 RepID=A0A124EPZ9_9MYCO|nr:DUF305 domain-containing protein [Mycobacterium lehmannii]
MTRSRYVVAAAAVLAATSLTAACSNSASNESPSASPTNAQTSIAAPTAAHNHADVMFAHHMIPHHQQAIEMSDMILAKQGIDPRVVDLAKQIKDAQGPEIKQMQGWLDQWGMPEMSGMPGASGMPGQNHTPGNMPPGHGGMHGPDTSGSPMPGGSMMPSGSMMPGMGGMSGMEEMLSPAEMQALRDSQGVEASKLFLSQMIEHHQGAITMAQNEINNGQFPDAVALAKSIVSSQQKEIDTMNEILKSL